jgi:hypothetical protein
MRPGKYVPLFAVVTLGMAAAGGLYLAKRKAASAPTTSASNPSSAHTQSMPEVKPQGTPQGNESDSSAENTTSFLGTLTPGGASESAGRERNYIVTYQVAFLRKTPADKLSEESLTYEELRRRDLDTLAPAVFYGESVTGTYDPAHLESIAVRTKIDNKEVRGYVDAQ